MALDILRQDSYRPDSSVQNSDFEKELTIKNAQGDTYIGKLKNDKPHGLGVVIYADGDNYTGNFENGVPEGKGKMAYADGDVFIGQFKRGQPNG